MTPSAAQEVDFRPVSFLDLPREALVAAIAEASGGPVDFVAVNAHTAYLAETDPEFRRILPETFRFCDGFGIHLLCVAQGLSRPRYRATPTDFMWDVFERLSGEGKTVFLLGDEPGVAEKFGKMLNAKYPGLVCGHHHGFFSDGSPEEGAVRGQIDRCRPHLLCVGMGQPRQEKWAHSHRGELPCSAILHLGASMAFAIGARRRGPAWATNHGLEWAFRVLHEPRKMVSRYFFEIPWLIFRSIRCFVRKTQRR